VDPHIAAAFASRSRDLEQLSVSYMVNAEDFLGACLPSWNWPRLESLALTSQLLKDGWGRREDIDALLYGAGTTALRMPRLRTLAIWDGREGNACAFIYHTDRYYAYVTWRGTWRWTSALKWWRCGNGWPWRVVHARCGSRSSRFRVSFGLTVMLSIIWPCRVQWLTPNRCGKFGGKGIKHLTWTKGARSDFAFYVFQVSPC
jgi:hypothetical protein